MLERVDAHRGEAIAQGYTTLLPVANNSWIKTLGRPPWKRARGLAVDRFSQSMVLQLHGTATSLSRSGTRCQQCGGTVRGESPVLPRLIAIAQPDAAIAGKALAGNLATGYRLLHTTLGFMQMRATGEPAVPQKGVELGEVRSDFGGGDVPQLQLPDARCIDHPAPPREWPEPGTGRGVLPLARFGGDLVSPQLQPRFDGVDQ